MVHPKYNACFSHVKNLFTVYGYNIQTTSTMLDYEKAPRNALGSIFPNIQCKDDYFHLCKCLWTNARKYSLCEDRTLKETILLIGFFKILVHVEKEARKEFFDDIKTFFLEKNKIFKDFIEYFERNWLESAMIDIKNGSKEDVIERTNNICEGFNHMYNKHIGMKKPQLAKYISKLLELETYYRQRTLKKIRQGESDNTTEKQNSEVLPFTLIYLYLEDHLKQIDEMKHNLRSTKLNSDFVNSLIQLNQECYKYFYCDEGLSESKEEDYTESKIFLLFISNGLKKKKLMMNQLLQLHL